MVLILWSLVSIFPLVWMFMASLKEQNEVFSNLSLIPQAWKFMNYVTAWNVGNFGIYFFNSVFYTAVTLGLALLLSSMAAYAFARFRFLGRNFFYFLFIGSLMIPIPGAFIPLYVLLIKLGLADTRLGLILPYTNASLALAIFILKTFFENIPKDIEEAAIIDGCGKFDMYWRIFLPLAKPAIATVSIFTVLNVWNEFLLALIVINNRNLMPIQRGIMVFQGEHLTDYPLLMAGLTIATVPLLVVYFFLSKYILKGITAGAVKG
ncbi:carbohydrate ABC transporter permease [candidate division FCPU426 bacterium]|nr:carbohydrate ABC transporter permease [candidate division FCPU426 bacterium]